MIHKCEMNGCTFDDETGIIFVDCPVCGQPMDGVVKEPEEDQEESEEDLDDENSDNPFT